jgi:hypothetical protein
MFARPGKRLLFPYLSSHQLYCRLHLSRVDNKKAIYRSIRMLLSLPQLTELELNVFHSPAVTYISRCLLDLCNLHKITLRIVPEDDSLSPQLSPQLLALLGALLVRNPNLSHLTFLDSPINFSQLLHGVQSLDLKHVSIDSNCSCMEALVPHLQSLHSFEYLDSCQIIPGNGWCNILRKANVFPPKIKADCLDDPLLEYIHRHPGLTSLSLGWSERAEAVSNYLSQLLAQHCETLQYLAISTHTLDQILDTISGEINFLKCTKLREIVLIAANHKYFGHINCRLDLDSIGHASIST